MNLLIIIKLRKMEEVLVCFSFNETVGDGNNRISTSGKQYCWMDEPDFLLLKEEKELHLEVGSWRCGNSITVKLMVEKVIDPKLILIMREETWPFSSTRIKIIEDEEDEENLDFPYLRFKKTIKYRVHSRDIELMINEPIINTEVVENYQSNNEPLPDIIRKIMGMNK